MSKDNTVLNEKGQCIGYRIPESSGDYTLLNQKGEKKATVKNGYTYDAKGKPKGPGDQAMRLL